MTIDEKLQLLPAMPGCYLHKDERGGIIYIGKAKSLKNRVRSYFQTSRSADAKTRELVARIADFDYIVTDTEAEALILESNLVKRYQPRYNVLLKDDKQYPRIKITNEPYPRAVLVRRLANDGAHYYGPFLPASLAYQTLELINKYFMLRTCQIDIDGKLDRPCLEYHIKRCLGPCVRGLCTREEYDEAVTDVLALLDGKAAQLEQSLTDRMDRASGELRYEMAAKYRDQLRTIERLAEQQKMMRMSEADIDIFGLHRDGTQLALILFTMREGKVVGKREYFFEDIAEPFDAGAFLGEALAQYYAGSDYAPGEVHVPADFDDRELLEQVLSGKRGRRVRIRFMTQPSSRPPTFVAFVSQAGGLPEAYVRYLTNSLREAFDLPGVPSVIEAGYPGSAFSNLTAMLAPTVLLNGAFPVLVRLHQTDPAAMLTQARRVLILLLLVASPAALVLGFAVQVLARVVRPGIPEA